MTTIAKLSPAQKAEFYRGIEHAENLHATTKTLRRELDARFPTGGTMGLRSDETKADPEYQALKGKLDSAFQAERSFNERFVKLYAKELSEHRKAVRESKQA